jgi:hypothetical protein
VCSSDLALALEGNHRQARVLGPQRQAFSGIYKNLQRLIGARMRTAQIWSRRKPEVSNLTREMQPWFQRYATGPAMRR